MTDPIRQYTPEPLTAEPRTGAGQTLMSLVWDIEGAHMGRTIEVSAEFLHSQIVLIEQEAATLAGRAPLDVERLLGLIYANLRGQFLFDEEMFRAALAAEGSGE